MLDNYQGTEAGIYIGYSMGTVQMVGALSMASLGVQDYTPVLNNIQHAILLAPCKFVEDMGPVGSVIGLGIASVPSDDWETDVASICAELGEDSYLCQLLANIPADYSGRFSTKIMDHLAQNNEVQVFGGYVADWENSSKEPTEWPLSDIEMPITLVVAENDTSCLPSGAADFASQFETNGNLAGTYTLLEQTHEFFLNATAPAYIELLETEIANVIAGTAISVDGPFATDVEIVYPEEDDDDSALYGLSSAFAVAIATLTFIF